MTPTDSLTFHALSQEVAAIKDIVTTANDCISNEIAATSHFLSGFSIVFAIAALGLGVYIAWIQRQVRKMRDEISKKERIIRNIAKTVEKTDRQIHSDMAGLYADLRKEETRTLLERLRTEPHDVANLCKLLLARPLEAKDFPILKEAYLKMKKELEGKPEDVDISGFGSTFSGSYRILLFQHYLKEAILDDDIREDIQNDFYDCIQLCFKRDIIKSTEDLCRALMTNGGSYDKENLLAMYLQALDKSKYGELIDLKNIFQDMIANKDLRVNAIQRCMDNGVNLKLFGAAMLDNS